VALESCFEVEREDGISSDFARKFAPFDSCEASGAVTCRGMEFMAFRTPRISAPLIFCCTSPCLKTTNVGIDVIE